MKVFKFCLSVAAFAIAISGCSTETEGNAQQHGLSHYYADAFYLGNILNRAQIYGEVPETEVTDIVRADRRGFFYRRTLLTDPQGLAIAKNNFNALTPENVMKWEEIHPEPGVYAFDAADRFVNFAEANGMFITGHALVWHNQTPDWVFEDEQGATIGREALLERIRDHIHTVVGRYKGRIHSWDVVNEALNADGSWRESKWYQILGPDFIVKAFEYAHEADPEAELYYNDYQMETPDKRAGALRIVELLRASGAPIHGLGTQSHFSLLDFPSPQQVEQTILDFASVGVHAMVTELDINVLPRARDEDGRLLDGTDIYRDGLPANVQAELAARYKELFGIYLKHQDKITRVTLWGFADADSWLNYLPVERVNHPLLFDRQLQPKPAYFALIEAAQEFEANR
jgi:endo-1,4-beta-xylanase